MCGSVPVREYLCGSLRVFVCVCMCECVWVCVCVSVCGSVKNISELFIKGIFRAPSMGGSFLELDNPQEWPENP